MLQGNGLSMPKGAFGRLLRFWRRVHGFSQEALALDIGVSLRHISFLENGRSLPSQEIVVKLASLLQLNIRETNNLLAAAGFAPRSITLKPESEEHRWLQTSLIYTLRGLDPFPSVIIDQNGNARMINRAWLELICQYAPATAKTDTFNLIDLIFAKEGFRPYLQDWEDAICALIMTLQEDVLMYQDPAAVSLLQRVLAEPEVPDNWRQRGSNQMNITGFMTRTHLPGQVPEKQMHVVHTVGATSFVSEPRLMIYTIYPANPDRISVWEEQVSNSQKSHPLLFY